MAQFRNSPPPDWSGWGDDALYYPRSDPLSGGRPGTYLQELLDPALFGQNAPQQAPPGQFLASIGVNLPEPKTVLATQRYDPPPPPLTPLEPPAKQNTQLSGGVIKSDRSGTIFSPAQKSRRGVTPPDNEAQIDHIVPRNPRDASVAPGDE